MLACPDARLDLIEYLDYLVTQAHDKYKEAMINMLGLKFSNQKYQLLGDMTYKEGCAGFILQTKSDDKNQFEIVKNDNQLVIHDHTVEKYYDSKGTEISKVEYEDLFLDEDMDEFRPVFDNISDFMKWGKLKEQIRQKTGKVECKVEEKNEIQTREFIGGKVEIAHPNSLFNCTDISRPEHVLLDVQKDWKNCLEQYINLTNFVNKIKSKLDN